MGNQKLRLSSIIPNAWLYKLKEMSSNNKPIRNERTNTKDSEEHSVPRKSYHFSRAIKTPNKIPSPYIIPTKSSPSSSSVSSVCNCRSTTSAVQSHHRSKPISPLQSFDRMVAWSSTSCHCSSNSLIVDNDDDDDVVIGIDEMSLAPRTQDSVVMITKPELPPIKTEHKKFSDLVKEIGAHAPHKPNRLSGSPRVRIRLNSPKLSKRVENSNGAGGKKSVARHRRIRRLKSSESMAVVKSSADPQRDFRESMAEMIVENEIRSVKDLEELLACYLCLNSIEYHHLIIQAFKQIWFHMNQIQ